MTGLRVLHTADWHLGHSLHGQSREYEHRAMLAWLLQILQDHAVDTLIVAGDVFDSANPSASAQAMFYRFLADACRLCPRLQIVIAGGNHDSPSRLDAPRPLLESLRVHMVGGLPKVQNGDQLDFARLLLPLRDASGKTAAWCAALPFLRAMDLPVVETPPEPAEGSDSSADPLIEGVRRVYAETLAAARDKLSGGQALLATGHCYMAGGEISELSERKVLGGNQHALPADIFPADVAYAALGHLHRPQAVGKRQQVRYSGSPLPLSLAEADYPHQMMLVELAGGEVAELIPLRVPRSVDLLRIPPRPLPLAEVLDLLRQLDLPADLPPEAWPLIEANVLLDSPQPGLRHQLEESLAGRAARLVKINPHYVKPGQKPEAAAPEQSLEDLQPEEVFRRRYRQQFADEPAAALLAAFHEILEQTRAAE